MARTCRGLYLSLMGAVYWCAFTSYYLQYPGLLGEDGLLPARRFWEQIRSSRPPPAQPGPVKLDMNVPLAWWTEGVFRGHISLPEVTLPRFTDDERVRAFLDFPTWLWFAVDGSKALQVDQAMDLLALSGMALAALAVLGVHHVFVFLMLYLNYLSLFLLGQRWLGFQWDIFLLETGAMTLLYCPFGSRKASVASPPGAWLLRALIVKFMYMNGVVKVTANCPTWKNLTALEYHFASTCLPTSEAWIHHQLPPFLLRMGVAVMFLVELPLPFLLVCPILGVRRFGVLAQAALQVGIMVTGNYNWFNVHTLALLLPAWDADGDSRGASVAKDEPCLRSKLWQLANSAPAAWGRFWCSTRGLTAAFLASGVGTALVFFHMFEVHSGGSPWLGSAAAAPALPAFETWTVRSRFTARDVRQLSARVLSPAALAAFFVLVGASCGRWALEPLGRPGSMLRAAASAAGRWMKVIWLMPLLVICLLPLEHIHSGTASAIPFASTMRPWDQRLANWHVATSYGLFRRMTGVGEAPRGAAGWGGLPPSVVAVPGVVVEATDDGREWREIPFRYALGSEQRQPRRTAPHQPRLDWQMWFAALGSYQHNNWFIHLLYKVLEGSESVTALLDVDENPWARSSKPPIAVRAWLYHYDFTRLDTPWARSIPGTRILNTSREDDRKVWWTRTQVSEYVPAVGTNELKDIVKQQGWPVGKARVSALRRARNCTSTVHHSPVLGHACSLAVALREAAEPLQRLTGWELPFPMARSIWSAASDRIFVDINFLVIMVPLAVAAVLLAVPYRCRGRHGGKLKQE